MVDRSLDDFIGSGNDGDGDADGDAANDPDDPADTDEADAAADTADADTADGPDESESTDGKSTDSGEITPAESTYAWSPDPVPCGTCGEAVRRRWRDGGVLVCRDCKEW